MVPSPSPSPAPPFALEVLRAEHGDCLLLHHGPDLILIDGGPRGVYDATLKPRLEQLMDERGRPLRLRMVMVSHIDDDHVVGLADMFGDARSREQEHRGPAEWHADELWFNAFTDLTGAGGDGARAEVHRAELEAVVARAPGALSQAVAVSVRNGVALRDDAQALRVGLNASAGGGLVQAAPGAAGTVQVGSGLSFTVVAPSAARVTKLREKWEAWEREHRREADAETADNLDRSVFNLSSIVVLARSGERTMLLTGDARSDDIVDGLSAAGLLADGGPPLAVDVLKLPHHGSFRNVDASFFERVRARHYVISANGRDGNPDDATLGAICDARRADGDPWTLWLTYGGQPGDGRDGLHERVDAFLAGRRAAGQELDVRFAAPGQAHRIEL